MPGLHDFAASCLEGRSLVCLAELHPGEATRQMQIPQRIAPSFGVMHGRSPRTDLLAPLKAPVEPRDSGSSPMRQRLEEPAP